MGPPRRYAPGGNDFCSNYNDDALSFLVRKAWRRSPETGGSCPAFAAVHLPQRQMQSAPRQNTGRGNAAASCQAHKSLPRAGLLIAFL